MRATHFKITGGKQTTLSGEKQITQRYVLGPINSIYFKKKSEIFVEIQMLDFGLFFPTVQYGKAVRITHLRLPRTQTSYDILTSVS
jgi:hypothetical protein